MRAVAAVRLHLAHQRGIRLAASAVVATAAQTKTAALLLRTARPTLAAGAVVGGVAPAQTAALVS